MAKSKEHEAIVKKKMQCFANLDIISLSVTLVHLLFLKVLSCRPHTVLLPLGEKTLAS